MENPVKIIRYSKAVKLMMEWKQMCSVWEGLWKKLENMQNELQKRTGLKLKLLFKNKKADISQMSAGPYKWWV